MTREQIIALIDEQKVYWDERFIPELSKDEWSRLHSEGSSGTRAWADGARYALDLIKRKIKEAGE